MTWNVAMPSCLGALTARQEISTTALLLATALFYDCMKMSSAQDVSFALNRQSRESLGFRNFTAWEARRQMIE